MAHVTNGNNHLSHPSPDNLSETRFLARSVGLLALLTGLIYLRVIGIDSFTAVRSGQNAPGAIVLFLLVAAATLSLLGCWRWETAGGLLAVLCSLGIALLAFRAYPQHPFFAAFAYSSPFLFSGVLFAICRQRRQKVA